MNSKSRDCLCLLGFLIIVGLCVGAFFYGSNGNKKRFAKKIPVEFDPVLKQSCQESNYSNDDCVTLYDRFCGEAANDAQFSDQVITPGFSGVDFLEEGAGIVSTRSSVSSEARRLRESIAYEEARLGLAPLPRAVFNLTGEAQAEFAPLFLVDDIFANARSARLGKQSFWFDYRYTSLSFSWINSSMVSHVRARGLIAQCASFGDRVSSNDEIRRVCHDRVVDCNIIRNMVSVGDARNFFLEKLREYPDNWLSNPMEWLRVIPAEFSPNAATLVQQGRATDATSRPIAASFADAMGIPAAVHPSDALSIHVQLNRLYQATRLVQSSSASMGFFRQAVARVDGGRSADAALASIRTHSACARSNRFWPRFYGARNVDEMVAVYGDYSRTCSTSGSSSDDVHPDDECPICQEGGSDYVTRCRHRFHAGCLNRWLESHRECPTCRTRNPRV